MTEVNRNLAQDVPEITAYLTSERAHTHAHETQRQTPERMNYFTLWRIHWFTARGCVQMNWRISFLCS